MKANRPIVLSVTILVLFSLQALANAQCVRWIKRTDVGSPGERWSPAMAYDSDRGVTVLFGGATGPGPILNSLSDETWEYDGLRWQRIIIDGPSPAFRAFAAMCYDTVRHEMVLAGGAHLLRLKDTWVYRSTGSGHGLWIQKKDLPDNGYSQSGERSEHTMVFDVRRGVAVLVGGSSDLDTGMGGPPFQFLSDVLEWNGENWGYQGELFGLRFSGASYVGPTLHAMTYDTDTGTLSISGGTYFYYLTTEYDSWRAINWAQLLVVRESDEGEMGVLHVYSSGTGGRPLGGADVGKRRQHASVYDSDRKKIVIFGGIGEGDPGSRHDEAAYFAAADGSATYSASTLNIPTPPPRQAHVMVYDTRRHVTVLYGGIRDGNLQSLPPRSGRLRDKVRRECQLATSPGLGGKALPR